MQALKLPANQGWRWLVDGFALFRRRPLHLATLVMGYWLSMAMINAIPFVGQLLGFVLIPAFSVSLMNACRFLDRGIEVRAPMLFSGFHTQLPVLIRLGGIYSVCTLVALGLTVPVDGGALFKLVILGQMPAEEMMTSGGMMLSGQLAILFLLPVMLANWFAPILIAWHELPVAKSMFFSLVACFRNWKPFLVYGVAVVLIGALLPGFILGALRPLGGGEWSSVVMTLFVIGVLLPTLYASFYTSYRDIFTVSIDESV